MRLSQTQQALLEALRAYKAKGQEELPDARQRALGGLSEHGEREYLGVTPDGSFVDGIRVPGVSIRTYERLAALGLVDVKFGLWVATEQS